MELVPAGILQAFGLEDLVSPAGYLKGGLYDVVIPSCSLPPGWCSPPARRQARRTRAGWSCG